MIPSSTIAFADFVPRLCNFIDRQATTGFAQKPTDTEFNGFALELFALQFAHNPVYRKLCEARKLLPSTLTDWRKIPALPASAFKDFELTSLLAEERSHTFHSSGTTGQLPSRHFHNANSLAIYEASLLPWFTRHLLAEAALTFAADEMQFLFLTPTEKLAPHSSLAHMFATIKRELSADNSFFAGEIAADGSWTLDVSAALKFLQRATDQKQPVMLLGTAFNFVHLLDGLSAVKPHFELSAGSRVLETGGYKGRSRTLPKAELHALIQRQFGIAPSNIIAEYGMSELSSQAYDGIVAEENERVFQFPPWARTQLISPETGLETALGEIGLIRIFDLANVYSVMAIQTEDLGIRRVNGFELLGRATAAEARGCSLQSF